MKTLGIGKRELFVGGRWVMDVFTSKYQTYRLH
jgi:hypothetical protein